MSGLTSLKVANAKAAVIWDRNGYQLVITEAIIARRSGLHPLGRACDYRVNIYPKHTQKLLARHLAKELGDDYDVILHGKGANIHIHCEYDPTNPKVI